MDAQKRNVLDPARRILIIDDCEAIHRDFRRVLCPEQRLSPQDFLLMEEQLFGEAPARDTAPELAFDVDSAFQGEEGFAKVKQALDAGQPYALTILDYRMPPGWDGLETLRHLRKVAPSMPVVLCSAYSDYAWEQICHEFGESSLLVELKKPCNSGDLRRWAQVLVESRVAGPPAS